MHFNYLQKFKNNNLNLDEVLYLEDSEKDLFLTHLVSFLRFEPRYFNPGKKLLKALIPEVSPEVRLVFIKEIGNLIQDLNHHEGEITFEFLDEVTVNALSSEQRLELASFLKDLVQCNEVLASRSNVWGLVKVMPHLKLMHQKQYLDHLLALFNNSIDSNTIFKAIYSVVLKNKRQNRLNVILHMAEYLKNKEEDLDLRLLIIESLHTSMALILEEDRPHVMEAMLLALIHDERVLIEKVLDCFSLALQNLPLNHRYNYCMSLTPLAHEVPFSEKVQKILKDNMEFLQNEKEKQAIQTFVNRFQKPKANDQEDSEQQSLWVDQKEFS